MWAQWCTEHAWTYTTSSSLYCRGRSDSHGLLLLAAVAGGSEKDHENCIFFVVVW